PGDIPGGQLAEPRCRGGRPRPGGHHLRVGRGLRDVSDVGGTRAPHASPAGVAGFRRTYLFSPADAVAGGAAARTRSRWRASGGRPGARVVARDETGFGGGFQWLKPLRSTSRV